MKVVNRAGVPLSELASIELEVAGHRTLQQVLAWGLTRQMGKSRHQVISKVVTQDEYTHDVVVPWREELVLAYGTT